jgi:AcrR family transcriptional regulator
MRIVNLFSSSERLKQRAQKQPGAERKRLIIESAQGVFAAHGYANSGTEEVARAAGVAPSALYRYFPSKRELYLAALRDAGPRLLRMWTAAIEGSTNPFETIRQLGLSYYDHLQGRSPYAQLWFQALGDVSDADVREAIAGNFTAMVELFAGFIERAQEQGLARPGVDPRTAAWHFLAIGLSFDLIHHLGLDGELDRPRVSDWGDLYIESIREGEHGTNEHSTGEGRALPLRKPGGESRTERGGDPLPAVQTDSPDPVGEGGRDR